LVKSNKIYDWREKDMIPQDPVMLLSFVNMKLRDNYSNLEDLAEGLDISKDELNDIINKLESIDYRYDEDKNQFC
jgi:DNA-binding transcriptional regulator WhiA